jgi:osmoprotectant transport system ATP-binding protein
MIRIQNVSKSYGSRSVLKEVSYDFMPGRTYAVLGSSGSGKSTLLRIILGLVQPDSGNVWIGDLPMSTRSRPELVRNLGYVIQEGGLFPHLTCRENISLVARILKWPKEKTRARVRELCQLIELQEAALDRYPRELSGGQRQRVGLARALILDPPILILDEPLGALDPLIRSSLQKQLRELFRNLNKTVLIVTHDLAEAAYLGDNIVLLNEGHIAQSGSFSDLEAKPNSSFVTEFINAQRPPWELAEGSAK